jgi:gamma-glutamylcyclotransferase (GGCT)/AIG2-like uncharacterized protein YtfP
MPAEPLARVFVYGTLREGFRNPGRDILTTHGRRVDHARVEGTLYDMGAFPVLVPARAPDDRVLGEVYRLDREPARGLARLDRYEGLEGPEPLPYERRRRTVELEDGGEADAWVYVWTGELEDATRVPDGDYTTWLRGNEP